MDGVEQRLREALKAALRIRDGVAVAALRSALAAIGNAGAVDVAAAPAAAAGEHVAGGVAGLGAAEVDRRELTEPELTELVRAEIAERLAGAVEYERHGHHGQAAGLRAEAHVLARVVAAAADASGDIPADI